MTFYENVLTGLILLGILVIGYLKVSKQTFPEFVKELREVISPPEQIIEGGLTTR